MKKNKIVITTHSLSEAITKCVMDNRKYFDVPIIIVSLQELLSGYTIFDKLTDSGSTIRWYKGSDFCISNIDYVLLNRVLYVPNEIFNDFVNDDKEYAQRELEAYIGFAFNSFKGIGNKSPKGGVADILSLPQQWDSLGKQFDIIIPKYYWGLNDSNNLKNKGDLIYSTIYNFMNWSRAKPPHKNEHIFCFEKPQGKPVFILSIGEKQLITSDFHLSVDIKVRLKEFSKKIYLYFNYFIFEMLVFVDGNNLNFGCTNLEIIRSNKNLSYNQFVCHNLVSEFYKCMN